MKNPYAPPRQFRMRNQKCNRLIWSVRVNAACILVNAVIISLNAVIIRIGEGNLWTFSGIAGSLLALLVNLVVVIRGEERLAHYRKIWRMMENAV